MRQEARTGRRVHATTLGACLQTILAHHLDRRALLALATAGREVRYEELRKGIGEQSKQLFGYAVDRLQSVAALSRRLEPRGRRYHSFLMAAPRGILVARVLRQLARSARTQFEDEAIGEELRAFFVADAGTRKRDPRRAADDARGLFKGHREAIREVMERRHVRRLVAFGSRARGDARPDSDLDLAAEFAKEASALDILAAERELEAIVGIDVHIVELPNKRLGATIKREGVSF